MRCFLAIELPASVRDRLAPLQRDLAALDRAVRWTKVEQIHLTLKFLGEVSDANLSLVCAAVAGAGTRFAPFEIRIAGAGCFPPRGWARIVWAGVRNPPTELLGCQRACEQSLAALGIAPEDRPYHPHLTIGRAREGRDAAMIRPAVEAVANFDAGRFTVPEIVLFQSILNRSGPTHVPVHRAALGGHAP